MGDYIPAQDGTIIRDFIARTLHNLEFIEAQARNQGGADGQVYEVTQLINSMLGLLIFPREEFWVYLSQRPLNTLPPEFQTLQRAPHARDLRQLIRLMRNSFAHFNVEAHSFMGQIDVIVLTNVSNHKQVTWQMEIAVDELRAFVAWFAHGIMDSSLLSTPIQQIRIA
jgi:hypothetical protein